MFNVLQISSTTFSALRCKQCLSILFRQDNIKAFISYDSQDLGALQKYSNFPKLQGEAFYLVLDQQVTNYSSMKINYEHSLMKNYHPFFKMHLIQIFCPQCQYLLGYFIETVNQNTLWLQDKIIINVENCSLLKDGKDQMQKLIKILRSKLIRKLILQQQEDQNQVIDEGNKNKNEKLRKMKQKSTVLKLEKLVDSTINKYQCNHTKNQQKIGKNSELNKNIQDENQNLSKAHEQLVSTNACSVNLVSSKQDTFSVIHSVLTENLAGGDNEECKQGLSQDNKKISSSQSRYENGQKQKIQKIKKDNTEESSNYLKDDDIVLLPSLNVSYEQRQWLINNLHKLRAKIQKQSGIIESKYKIQRILNCLIRLEMQKTHIQNKIPSQLIKFNSLLTHIREKFIQHRNK